MTQQSPIKSSLFLISLSHELVYDSVEQAILSMLVVTFV